MEQLTQIGQEWSNTDLEINKLKLKMKELNEKKKRINKSVNRKNGYK